MQADGVVTWLREPVPGGRYEEWNPRGPLGRTRKPGSITASHTLLGSSWLFSSNRGVDVEWYAALNGHRVLRLWLVPRRGSTLFIV